MIEAISHITFIVRDLERMTYFLRTIFAAEELYDSGAQMFSHSREKFFRIGGTWIAAMQGEPLGERSYNHVAFKISETEFDAYEQRVRCCGVDIRSARSRVEGEGRSLYFYDYDNHLFELHTGTLEQRLARYSESEAE